jgi:ankyrin repeat protein
MNFLFVKFCELKYSNYNELAEEFNENLVDELPESSDSLQKLIEENNWNKLFFETLSWRGQLALDFSRELAELVDVNVDTHTTCLRASMLHDRDDLIPILVRAGANINETYYTYKNTALITAVFAHKYKSLKALLEQGANLNLKNANGWSPLHYAAWCDDIRQVDFIEILLKHGAKIDATDNWGATPLILAARQSNLQSVLALLSHGADPNVKNKYGYTALQIAENDYRIFYPILRQIRKF